MWPAPTSSGHLEGSSKNNSTDSVSLNQAFVVLRPAKLDPKSDPEDLPSLRTRPPSWFPFLSNFPLARRHYLNLDKIVYCLTYNAKHYRIAM